MRAFTIIAAVALTVNAAAQGTANGPTSTGFGEGAWNAGLFEQQTTGRVIIFPNPADDRSSIVFPGFTGPAIVTIIASDGRVMEQKQMNQTAGQQLIAETADLADGCYLVNVEQDGDRVVERLVVEHGVTGP
ncbi:MAG: T9SS type A sorting domain-containing protein [Flavobacteriales bacterium]